jgi:TolB-like protein
MKPSKYGLAALFLVLPFTLFAQEKYALVIGNGAYTSITKLNNPVNDAGDMAAALQSLGFHVEKLVNAGRVQMEEAVARFKNRLESSKTSYGFLFYAGHGVQAGGENYLIPVNADIGGEGYLRDRAVPLQAVLDELNSAGNALNVVVLDACRDNPFSWKRGGSRGLTVVNQPADSIIVYATSAGSAAEDGEGRNGLFTGHLLKNLRTPGLEVEEVFKRTGGDVARASGGKQRPAVYNQFYGTAYLGAKPAAARQQASAVQPPAQSAAKPAPQSAPRVQRVPSDQTTYVLSKAQSAVVARSCESLSRTLPANSTVAVLSVKSEDNGLLKGLSASVTDEIVRNLANSGRLRVLDSGAIKNMYAELLQKFYDEDESSAKIPEADILITGNISGSGSSRILRLTATDAKTKMVLAATSDTLNLNPPPKL